MANFWVILLGALGFFFGNDNPVYHLPPLALLYPATLYYLAVKSKTPYRDTIFCALLGPSAAFYWVTIAVYEYGQIPLALAVPCAMVGGLFVGIFWVAFVWIIRFFSPFPPFLRCIIVLFAWTALEYARGYVFTGFPWFVLASSFSIYPTMIQGVSIIGSYALSGVLACVSCFFMEARFYFRSARRNSSQNSPTRNKWYGIITFSSATLILLTLYGFGEYRINDSYNKPFWKNVSHEQAYRTVSQTDFGAYATGLLGAVGGDFEHLKAYHSDPAQKGAVTHSLTLPNSPHLPDLNNKTLQAFTLVQGNVSQGVKWNEIYQDATVKKYIRLSIDGEIFADNAFGEPIDSILVWPETAMPFYFQATGVLSSQIHEFGTGRQLFFGSPAIEKNGDIFNSLFFLDKKNSENIIINSYDKEHLVPFGEYFPDWPLPSVLRNILGNFGGFSKGTNNTLIQIDANNPKSIAGVFICYEAIFPEIAREQVKKGANVFVNVSNDAWYDNSSAAKQHLDLSLLRAVEQNRFIVRAGNTGISAFIDPYGRVMASTNIFTDETLSGVIAYYTEKTHFYRISPYILPFVLLILLLFFIVGKFLFYRKKKTL